MSYFDDFDTEIQSDECNDGEFDMLCPHCGTNHSNSDDESLCQMSDYSEDQKEVKSSRYAPNVDEVWITHSSNIVVIVADPDDDKGVRMLWYNPITKKVTCSPILNKLKEKLDMTPYKVLANWW